MNDRSNLSNFSELIESSSLGTPGARSLRERAPLAIAQGILARAAEAREAKLRVAVTLQDVTKTLGDGTVAVDRLSLAVYHGEFVVLVGPSGCGKSTVLRLIAGLEKVTSGTVAVGGRAVNDLEPADRDIAMVFQEHRLYPHLTVAENIGFGLRLRGTASAEMDRRVIEAARLLGLEDLLGRKPATLSAGQGRLVAIAHAIVRQPEAFLLDEPFLNLDSRLRSVLRGELSRVHQELGTTTIFVTHDQVEAMTLGDRIVVLDRGRARQVGTPEELFSAPDNLFVAGFIGAPGMNFARARLTGEAGSRDLALAVGRFRWALPPDQLLRRPALAGYVGRDVVIGLRPNAFAWTPEWEGRDMPSIAVEVVGVEVLGTERHVEFVMPTPAVNHPDLDYRMGGDEDDAVWLARPGDGASIWTARIGPWARVFGGEVADLTVDLDEAHFFDPDTGVALPPVRSEEPVAPSAPAGQLLID
jgi:multiple sugar transport system ATP-binding protein